MRPIRPVPHQRRPLQPPRPNYDLNETEFMKLPIEVRPTPPRSRTRRMRRACGPLGPRYLCTAPGRLLGKGAVRLVSWHWGWSRAATGVLAILIHIARSYCICIGHCRHATTPYCLHLAYHRSSQDADAEVGSQRKGRAAGCGGQSPGLQKAE